MGKIELLYPNQTDIKSRYNRFENPEYFYHFCYFGCQLFLVKSRNKYVLKSMGFVPSFIRHLDASYIVSHVYLNLYESTNFDSAVFMFQKSCTDLIYDKNLAYLSKFDVKDLTPLKYPHEVNIVRKVFC